MDNDAAPTPPAGVGSEDFHDEKVSMKEPLTPEETLWRQFDKATKQQVSLCLYVLNVSAWEVQDLDSFVSYDALEEILPLLHIHRQWTWQHAECPPESDPILRSLMTNRSDRESSYKTDLSVEFLEKCDPQGGQGPKFIFFELVNNENSWHDVAMVAHTWNIETDLWNQGCHFSNRVHHSGIYCLAHCQRHHRQYLFRYEGQRLKLFCAPIKLPDEWPHHFAASLWTGTANGGTSVMFLSFPDDFIEPLYNETNGFDHLT